MLFQEKKKFLAGTAASEKRIADTNIASGHDSISINGFAVSSGMEPNCRILKTSARSFMFSRSEMVFLKTTVREPYRGFESLFLRHTVWTAENSRLYFPKNPQIMPIFRDSCLRNRTAENGLP